jgi:phosphonate transport system substrate-binding protein
LFFSILVLVLFQACAKNSNPEGEFITMVLNPAEASERVNLNGKVVADILEKKTGYKFKTLVASDYSALISALRAGQADIAWLAPFAYVLAEAKGGARLMLKSVRHGTPHQFSAIIVKEESPYKKLEDLKGKTIAWADPASSSGHISPKAALISQGIDPQTFFDKQTFAGSHETVVLSVATGSTDAGATYSDTAEGVTGSWTKFASKLGPAQKLRAIYVTPPMPADTVSASSQFSEKYPEKLEKVKEALKSLSETAEGREALKQLYSIDSLIDAKPEDYEPLRKATRSLGYDVLDKK